MASALSPPFVRGVSGIHPSQFSDYKGKCIQVCLYVGQKGVALRSCPVPATQKWGWLPCFHSFTLPQIRSPIEGIVLGILKARWGMDGPKAKVSLLQAHRPKFYCLHYKFQSNFIFYYWMSKLIGLKISVEII